ARPFDSVAALFPPGGDAGRREAVDGPVTGVRPGLSAAGDAAGARRHRDAGGQGDVEFGQAVDVFRRSRALIGARHGGPGRRRSEGEQADGGDDESKRRTAHGRAPLPLERARPLDLRPPYGASGGATSGPVRRSGTEILVARGAPDQRPFSGPARLRVQFGAEAEQLQAGVDAELGVGRGQVRFHRALSDEELAGDLLGRAAGQRGPHDLPLPFRERRRPAHRRPGPPAPGPEAAQIVPGPAPPDGGAALVEPPARLPQPVDGPVPPAGGAGPLPSRSTPSSSSRAPARAAGSLVRAATSARSAAISRAKGPAPHPPSRWRRPAAASSPAARAASPSSQAVTPAAHRIWSLWGRVPRPVATAAAAPTISRARRASSRSAALMAATQAPRARRRLCPPAQAS